MAARWPNVDICQRRYTFYTWMDFEFDPEKSETNRRKHGIDFVEAQELSSDPDAIGFPAQSFDEERALLARRNGKLWIVFYTVRRSRIRLISVRRARDQERRLYES